MANKALFQPNHGPQVPSADALNEEHSPAYAFSPEHALAQYAVTGCLNSTFYATAGEQLGKLLRLAADCDPEFVAQTAVYCRQRGFMKDTPALLCAVLSTRAPELLERIFDRVIDNAKMLRCVIGAGPVVGPGSRIGRGDRTTLRVATTLFTHGECLRNYM